MKKARIYGPIQLDATQKETQTKQNKTDAADGDDSIRSQRRRAGMSAISAPHRSRLPSLSRPAMSSAPKVIAAGVWASEGPRRADSTPVSIEGGERREGGGEAGVASGGGSSRNAGEFLEDCRKKLMMVKM